MRLGAGAGVTPGPPMKEWFILILMWVVGILGAIYLLVGLMSLVYPPFRRWLGDLRGRTIRRMERWRDRDV